MYKKWKLILAAWIVALCLNCGVIHAAAEVESTEGLIPLRQAAESAGFLVEWNDIDHSVEIVKENTRLKITINQTDMEIADKSATLSAAPVLINDRTYVSEEFFYSLPQIYITQTDNTHYSVTQCDTPSTETMIGTIAALSSQPRGIADATHQNAKQYLLDALHTMGYQVQIQDFEYTGWKTEGTLSNIIVTKYPTLEKTGDVLILGAHYDGAAGFPAANDNGSGVSVLLEIARIIKDLPTDTEIRFVFFDGEEDGLVGSKHYVQNLADSQNVIGMINFDMLGAQKAQKLAVHTNNNKENHLFRLLADMPQYQNMELVPHPYGISDYVPFVARVIPTLDVSHESIQGEYHNENDLIEHIDPAKLEQSAHYGIALTKKIMSNTTPSFMDMAKPMRAIGTVQITENTHIDTAELVDVISRHLGTELVQVESDTEYPKYMVYVNLFGLDENATMIYEGQLGDLFAGNPVIEFTNTNITFDEIKTRLEQTFGISEQQNVGEDFYYRYKNNSGNVYNLHYVTSEQRFYMDVNEFFYDEKEGYAITNSGIVRVSNDNLAHVYNISNMNGNITVQVEYCLQTPEIGVTPNAQACWDRLKPYFNSNLLTDIPYLVVSTNGIGNGTPLRLDRTKYYIVSSGSYGENQAASNPVPDAYKDMPAEVIDEIKRIPPGNTFGVPVNAEGDILHIDYMDLLDENGNAYSDTQLVKAVAYAWCTDQIHQNFVQTPYPENGTNFEKMMYRYNPNSFVYAFTDLFYREIFALENLFDYDLYGMYPDLFVCEQAAQGFESDIAASFAEFVVAEPPTDNGIAQQKTAFFYAYPEFVEARNQFRQLAGL